MAKGGKAIVQFNWSVLSGNVEFDDVRESRLGSIGGGKNYRWSTISGNLEPPECSPAEYNNVGGPAWEIISGNVEAIPERRFARYESSAPGYVWMEWETMSGNLKPLDNDAREASVLHDLKWGTTEKHHKHRYRGTSWDDLRSKMDRGEKAELDTTRSKSGSGSPKRKRLSLTGALLSEFLDGECGEDLGLMSKIQEGPISKRQEGQSQQRQEKEKDRKAAASRAKPPKPSHPRLSAELRAAATKVHSGYLHKEGGGTSFFGSKSWKKRLVLIRVRKID